MKFQPGDIIQWKDLKNHLFQERVYVVVESSDKHFKIEWINEFLEKQQTAYLYQHKDLFIILTSIFRGSL